MSETICTVVRMHNGDEHLFQMPQEDFHSQVLNESGEFKETLINFGNITINPREISSTRQVTRNRSTTVRSIRRYR
ncbi:hypothetical protein ACQGSX_14690 [Bacillus sp. GMs2/1]|uniref:hypothetical protein n=1 Tax=Bacillus sp. GMs2/1 TaxID=3418493 RepID=UPI003CF81435